MAEPSIRLDQFLCFARFAKTRSLAQEIVHRGHVRIDGRPAQKCGAAVKVGSILGLPLGDDVRIVRVAAIPARRGPAPEARACYTELGGQRG